MNIQQLKYFMVLCDKLSFSKAAEALFITQQGLNMAISNLESEFSCRLFRRTSGGLILTEDGEFFREHANAIMVEVGKIGEHFDQLHDSAGVVHLAGCQGCLSEFAANMQLAFENQHPGCRVYVREFKDRDVDSEVYEERAELGFGLEPMDTKKFECERVFCCPLVLLMRRDHPLAQYEKIPVSVLTEYPLIAVDEVFKSADFFIEECRKQGVRLEPKFRVGEITAVHRLVKQGVGVGLTSKGVADSLQTPGTVYRQFEGDNFLWSIDIFKKKNRALSKNAREFYAFACSRLSKSTGE